MKDNAPNSVFLFSTAAVIKSFLRNSQKQGRIDKAVSPGAKSIRLDARFLRR